MVVVVAVSIPPCAGKQSILARRRLLHRKGRTGGKGRREKQRQEGQRPEPRRTRIWRMRADFSSWRTGLWYADWGGSGRICADFSCAPYAMKPLHKKNRRNVGTFLRSQVQPSPPQTKAAPARTRIITFLRSSNPKVIGYSFVGVKRVLQPF